jgi:hypothetical protein
MFLGLFMEVITALPDALSLATTLACSPASLFECSIIRATVNIHPTKITLATLL